MQPPSAPYRRIDPENSTPLYKWCIFGTSVFSFAVIIAAMATPMFTYDTDAMTVRTWFWKTEICPALSNCESTMLPDTGACTPLQDRQRAMQAFLVLALLSSIVGSITGFMDAKNRLGGRRWIPFAFLVATEFSVLLVWGIIGGTYHLSLCGFSAIGSVGFKLSIAFSLLLCLWIVQCGTTLYSVVKLRSESGEEKVAV